MTLTAEQQRTLLATRDLPVDLVRVCCVLLVVVLHSLMVGLGVDASGHVRETNVLQAQPWFAVASWFGQVMPLFFVVGGFASAQGWASVQRKGGGGAEFFRARLLRLGTPAAVWFVAVGALIWAAVGLGAPVSIAALLAGGIGMPLWFLAAYLICQAVVPLQVRAHRAHPVVAALMLLAACIAVDVLRYSTGVTAFGLLNLVFLWPLVQQIGFLYADGTLQRLPRWSLVGVAVAAFAIVGLLGELGPYSTDMLDNLNPPTTPLVFIGVGQIALFVLAKPALDALLRRRAAQGFVLFLGTRLMTIYLWHLLVVILVAALAIIAPSLVPAVGTAAWWWVRIPADLLIFGVLIALSFAVARFERGPGRVGPTPSIGVLAVAGVLAVVPPFWAMEFRLDLAGLVWGSAATVAAVLLARGARPVIPVRRERHSAGSTR